MVTGTSVIVAGGILAAVLLAIGVGIDATGLIIFAAIVLVGLIAVGAARKVRASAVAPATCPECGGLISPNAPHCKHCGATFD